MTVHRIKTHIRPNEPLVLNLPADIPEADVDVLVLFPETPSRPSRFASLKEFDDWLVTQLPSGRSVQDIDRQIAQERASWG